MINGTGIYLVVVNPKNNPTYLHDAFYAVRVQGRGNNAQAYFQRLDMNAGTGERVVMMNVFEQQGRVTCTPVMEKWELEIREGVQS